MCGEQGLGRGSDRRQRSPIMGLEQYRLHAARRMAAHIAELLQGDLSLELWNGEVLPLGPNARDDARIVVRSPRAVRRLLLRPTLTTLFTLYAEEELDFSGANPLVVLRRFDHFRSLAIAENFDKRLALSCAWPFLLHAPARGARAGYAKKIERGFHDGRDDDDLIRFHYDVSNAFYAMFLDSEMVYSCGYFETAETSLDDAQIAKLDRICRKLRLQPGDRLLDIGSGWGGLLCHAAKSYGAHCHGVTLSQAQYDFTAAKIASLGLSDLVTLELRDYRSIEPKETYDKIAQIEMFEHVGIDNHNMHFDRVRALLRPRGLYLHQATTRWATPELSRFRKPTRYQKVINRFIFPGGELDYIGLTATNLERHGFEIHDVESLREHFQLTIEHWLDRLYLRREEAFAEIGRPRARMWMLYFLLFGRGFERGVIGAFQTLASKRNVGSAGLPLQRFG